MRKVGIVWAFVCCQLFSTAAKSDEALRIVSINVHCLLDDWRSRYDHMVHQLVALDPDIIGLQEVCSSDHDDGVAYLVDRLRGYGWQAAATVAEFTHPAFDRYREYVAILSRRYPDEVRQGRLPDSPLQRSYTSMRIGGVWFVSTHLEYRDEWSHYRHRQIEFLIERYRDEAVVLMGDWNSHETWHEQRQLHQNGFVPQFPGNTFPAGNASRAIDGFWIGPAYTGDLSAVRSAVVLDTPMADRDFPTDHYGVLLEGIRL